MSFRYLCMLAAVIAMALAFVAPDARADACSTVIPGASGQGYQGPYGGYDARGLCHIRDISEADCHRLTGSLFYHYSPDNGAGFAHCAFRYPSRTGRRSRGENPCSQGYHLAGGNCIPDGAVYCGGGTYCQAGEVCLKGRRCMSAGSVDCGTFHCKAGQVCARSGCR